MGGHRLRFRWTAHGSCPAVSGYAHARSVVLFVISLDNSSWLDWMLTLLPGMEIRVAVTAYVSDRIAASRQSQSLLPSESPDKVPGGYTNVSVIRANSMKHMPNFFARAQASQFVNNIRARLMISDGLVDKDVLPFSGSTLQVEKTEGEDHHVWFIGCQESMIAYQSTMNRTTLLAVYAFVLKPGGILYTVTDVKGEPLLSGCPAPCRQHPRRHSPSREYLPY